MNPVLVIVDIQRDFCVGGALAVPDANAVIPVVNDLIRSFPRVVLTQDWHPPGHVSFASSHPGRRVYDRLRLPSGPQVLWPDHCVADTPGATFHPDLEIPPDACLIRKGVRREIDSYSAFFENDGTTSVGLDALLQNLNARKIVLAGLATDYCVLHTAIDARRLGYDVTVVAAGCRGIDLDGSVAKAWRQMETAGVRRE